MEKSLKEAFEELKQTFESLENLAWWLDNSKEEQDYLYLKGRINELVSVANEQFIQAKIRRLSI